MTNNLRNLKIQRALISVYSKDGLEPVVKLLHRLGVTLCSTGGTLEYIRNMGIEAEAVEDITGYPSLLGGRVKTLHPKIFGGILQRRENERDCQEARQYGISPIDLVLVDLYPFEETLASGAGEAEIIEKIDIGGVALIRAAAKNYKNVLVVASREHYPRLMQLLEDQEGRSTLSDRRYFAALAFNISSHYDTQIFEYFNREFRFPVFKKSILESLPLRYGENPHQHALFVGKTDLLPEQLHGKDISYNNLLDIESALKLINDFEDTTLAIIKHNNPCGCATRPTVSEAWDLALAADPVSAFGGIIVTNAPIDMETAQKMNTLFFEVLLAPEYDPEALQVLCSKKNRILLRYKPGTLPNREFRSLLGGLVMQDRDCAVEAVGSFTQVTQKSPNSREIRDMLFANKLVKHSKSNAIVLAKDCMQLASGIGQTSRIEALKQAIEKARMFGFSLEGAVMASDAFFPFADCVDLAATAGITAIIQPGGSIRDSLSIQSCDKNGIAMIFTGTRHFRH